jgi:hypothetical protein
MAIKHNFVSAIADGADATQVRPSNWNADHTIDAGTITDAMLTTTLASGVYTPTRSAEVNQDVNAAPSQAQYLRVGSVVTVSGTFTFNPTLAATVTGFEMTLPVASNIGAVADLAGTACAGGVASMSAEIYGSIANDTAVISWVSSDITLQTWSYTYTYRVI